MNNKNKVEKIVYGLCKCAQWIPTKTIKGKKMLIKHIDSKNHFCIWSNKEPVEIEDVE